MSVHDQAVLEERRARERQRNLDKGRRIAVRNRERAAREARKARLAELREQRDSAFAIYRKAFGQVRRYLRRVRVTVDEERAWAELENAGMRARGLAAAVRRMERER